MVGKGQKGRRLLLAHEHLGEWETELRKLGKDIFLYSLGQAHHQLSIYSAHAITYSSASLYCLPR